MVNSRKVRAQQKKLEHRREKVEENGELLLQEAAKESLANSSLMRERDGGYRGEDK